MTSSMVDVSVITANLNNSDYLASALTSVLRQQDVTVEMIYVDDGSTDNSLEIASAIAASDPRVKIIAFPENRGTASARNAALDIASGRYICLLDSDDELASPTALSQARDAADAQNTDVLICNFARRFANTFRKRSMPDVGLAGGVGNIDTHPGLINTEAGAQMVYSRAFLEKHGLRYRPELRHREDRAFVFDCMLHAERVGECSTLLFLYRGHDGSVTATRNPAQFELYVRHVGYVADRFAQPPDRPGVDAFRKAAAAFYWHQALGSWSDYVVTGLTADDQSTPEIDLTETFLMHLERLAKDVPTFFDVPYRNRRALTAEGRVDMLRLCLNAQRNDLAIAILKGEALAFHDVVDLVAASDHPDAEAIGNCYLRFVRRVDYKGISNAPANRGAFGQIKRVILHTGLPKTGSTAIQAMLAAHRIALLKSGIVFPTTGVKHQTGRARERTGGHHSWMRAVIAGRQRPIWALKQELGALPFAYDTLILSAEGLLFMEAVAGKPIAETDAVGQIASLFPDASVELCMITRAPDRWLPTMYLEHLRNQAPEKWPTPLAFAKRLTESGFLDFDRLIDELKAHPNLSKVTTTTYEALDGGDAVAWFLSATGLSDALPAGKVTGQRANTTLSHAQLTSYLLHKVLNRSEQQLERALDRILSDERLLSHPFRLLHGQSFDEDGFHSTMDTGLDWFMGQLSRPDAPDISTLIPLHELTEIGRFISARTTGE